MRSIHKLGEPSTLTEYRSAHLSTYIQRWKNEDKNSLPKSKRRVLFDNFRKTELRQYLYKEQRGLCCYCSGSLKANRLHFPVAHCLPVDLDPSRQLDYGYLLGSCDSQMHCDSHQKSSGLVRNPANPQDRIDDIIFFEPDGTIRSSDPDFDRELGNPRLPNGKHAPGVLNLNDKSLRNSRKAVLDSFTKTLSKRGHLGKTTIRNLMQQYSGANPGELPSFAPVIAYWLKKRLARER